MLIGADEGVNLAVGHIIGGVITADLKTLSAQSRSPDLY